MLTKEEILNANDRQTSELDVPEWGGRVRISTMSGFARDRFEASIVKKQGGINTDNIRAKLVAACLIDDSGNLLFSESDIEQLGKKSCRALDAVFAEAQSLNKIGSTEVETQAKNS